MAFRVGQKVVCVDANPRNGHVSNLTEGAVYTVRAFGPSKDGSPGISLDEIYHPFPFYQDRFRPVVERKTDISVFTKMLTGSKVGADA